MEAFRIKFHSGKKGKSFILKKRPTWEMCKADPKKPAQGAFSTDAVLALRPLCGLNGGGRSNTAAPSPFPLFSQSSDFVYPFWPIQASTSSLFCKVAFFEVPYQTIFFSLLLHGVFSWYSWLQILERRLQDGWIIHWALTSFYEA